MRLSIWYKLLAAHFNIIFSLIVSAIYSDNEKDFDDVAACVGFYRTDAKAYFMSTTDIFLVGVKCSL
jgi:hypothetical protein